MFHRTLMSLGWAVGSLLIAAPMLHAEVKVEDKVVGPAKQGMDYHTTVSPKGFHVGTVYNSGSRFVVNVDGVESEKFDEVFASAPKFQDLPDMYGEFTQHAVQSQSAVAFSPDGTRYAFAGRVGKEVIVISDGKEIFRGPYSPSRPGVNQLQFSPDGKHVYFLAPTTDTMYSAALVMDGVQGPAVADVVWPTFSKDGEHYAYYAKKPTPQQEDFVVVDGKVVDWVAGRLRYTNDGKLVGVHIAQAGKAQLLVDGKVVMEATQIERLIVSPTGSVAAVGVNANPIRQLYLDGKPVPETEGAWNAVFSPDGKRLAVLCQGTNPPGAWVMVDGTKGQTYGGVSGVIFTGDSKKVVYVAEVQRQKFVIEDEKEYGPTNYILIAPQTGIGSSHYGFVWNDPMARKPVVDGKEFPAFRGIDGFIFSPDGNRWAFLASADVMGSPSLVIDGEQVPGNVPQGVPVFFSPDSKHIASTIVLPNPRVASIRVDDQIFPAPAGTGTPRLIGFTPDSKHLVFAATQDQPDRTTKMNIYLDGRQVAQLDGRNIGQVPPNQYDITPDGNILVLGTVGEKEIRRFVITPSDDTSLETWAKDVKDAQDKVAAAAAQKAADEEAAKIKAAVDRQAAIDAKNAAKAKSADKAAKKAGKTAPPKTPAP